MYDNKPINCTVLWWQSIRLGKWLKIALFKLQVPEVFELKLLPMGPLCSYNRQLTINYEQQVKKENDLHIKDLFLLGSDFLGAITESRQTQGCAVIWMAKKDNCSEQKTESFLSSESQKPVQIVCNLCSTQFCLLVAG